MAIIQLFSPIWEQPRNREIDVVLPDFGGIADGAGRKTFAAAASNRYARWTGRTKTADIGIKFIWVVEYFEAQSKIWKFCQTERHCFGRAVERWWLQYVR